MSSDLHNYGIIGFTADNVGIDRRIYTGLTSTDAVLNVSYNGGRVDVYLNGIKLVGDHSEMPSGTRDYTFTQTGSGSSIQLRTGVALVSADVVECIGHVGLGSNTITTYNYTASGSQTAFSANNVSSDLVNVFLNGVLLDSSDYNLNTSNTVTLASGATASDIVHIQVIGALDNSNFVPAGGGAFTGPITGVDVNGTELVLDADGDTSITADTDDQIDFRAGGTDSVKIGNEHLTINDGNLVIGTAGHGIDFSNATDTGTGETPSSSVLMDYETGTWSPSMHQAGSSTDDISGVTVTYARYTRIGTLVHLELILTDFHSGSFSTNNSAIVIGGIPFTTATPGWMACGTGSTYLGHYHCTAMIDNYAADKINLAHGSGQDYIIFSELFTTDYTRFTFNVTYQTT